MMRYRFESPPPASDNLAITGPMIEVSVGLDYEAASALLDQGDVPPSARVPLMLDTGAAVTLVDDALVQSLGLTPIRYYPLVLADGSFHVRPVYRISISIPMTDAAGSSISESFEGDTFGLDSGDQVHRGLMGRDLLRNFSFHYDGKSGCFELVSDRDQVPPANELHPS
jgi:predicted aspartyl protease